MALLASRSVRTKWGGIKRALSTTTASAGEPLKLSGLTAVTGVDGRSALLALICVAVVS